MTLAQYIAATGTTPTAFAAELGVHVSTITRLLHGQRGAGLGLALRITRITNGAVPVDVWVANDHGDLAQVG